MNCSGSSSAAYITTLQQLSSVAQSLKPAVLSAFRRADQQLPPTTLPNINKARLNVPPLSLPIPEEIASYLKSTGCSQTVASSLSDAFIRSAHQIHTAYEASYRQIADQLASDPSRFSLRLERLKSSLRAQYEEKILSAKKVVLNRADKLGRQRQSGKAKPKFNQEFVPLLETYFQYNAYPSAPDRAVLARKSMMTPRQIEVWFQNHRNRSSKEGKILRRLTSDPLPLKLSLDALEKNMSFFIIPEAERKSSVSLPGPNFNDERRQETVPSRQVGQDNWASFYSDAPPHAYPTKYPPTCDYDPFPQSPRHMFPAPTWIRRPTSSAPRHLSHNFDEFVADFAHKLNFRDTLSKNHHQRDNSPIPSQCPWYAATHTATLSAPHPALIQPPVSAQTMLAIPQPLYSTSIQFTYPRPFCVSKSFSRSATLVSTEKGEESTCRKIASLPRRTPKHSGMTYRGASPAMSDTSSTSSPSSSDLSSAIRSPSPSGGPTVSSALTTPERAIILLPNDTCSPLLSYMRVHEDQVSEAIYFPI